MVTHLERTDLSLITNTSQSSLYHELVSSIKHCNRFFFSVAFISYSGLQLLLDVLKEAKEDLVPGKIITSTYLNFTDVKSLKKLQEFKNIETKIFVASKQEGFHTKAYIFEYSDHFKIIVGSSNITQSALKSNIEWNIEYISKNKTHQFVKSVTSEFDKLWEKTNALNSDLIKNYEEFLETFKAFKRTEQEIFDYHHVIKPNLMQAKALEELSKLRNNNQNKALIIAATGTGKTYLSAFDVKNFDAKRILFLVHREVILNDAYASYDNIFPNQFKTIFQGSNKETHAEITFAMVQTMYNNKTYELFDPNHFDYIIADEAHRSFSPSYRTILEYFTPKFLLGMTATPERTDGGNIFDLFNNNIALEVRLRDALREDLVLPFHYFGIKDMTTDLSHVDISKIDEVAKRLSIHKRVDFVIEKMLHYGHSGKKRKGLGFCANKAHAQFMAEAFNAWKDYPSIALTGDSSHEVRREAINRLEDVNDPLEFIFTVDIFNEGIDIPSVNLVLMLRPTESPIIFTQQLGRGLRKHYEKEFLTVLDFIGNHNKTYLIPIALSGTNYYERDSLKVQVHNEFSDLPGCSHISLDKITKEDILRQLESVNFNAMQYLRREYREFRKVLGGATPKLTDYIAYENAPDPIKFILKSGSYNEFIAKMENKDTSLTEASLSIQQTLDKMLPIKRLNEFVIFKHLFTHKSIDIDTAKEEILKILTDIDDTSIKHSFKYLSGAILGEQEKDPFSFIHGNGTSYLALDNTVYTNLKTSDIIKDTLDYGILRYQEEFGKETPIYPYLKLYYPYKMKDMGFLTNYGKSFSSIRGSGVWRNGDHFYLFVDLHKEDTISESIDYKDKIIDQYTMQWETQNKTKQTSKTGRDLCLNQERGIRLHMFVRKAKKIGSQNIDYMYLGEVNTQSFEGNQPITIQMKFDRPLPKYVFQDLTQKIPLNTKEM